MDEARIGRIEGVSFPHSIADRTLSNRFRALVLEFRLTLRLASPLLAADVPESPIRACDVIDHLADFDGKVVAVVGRYSFRASGRSVGEEACAGGSKGALKVTFDRQLAPPTPPKLEFDSASVLRLMRQVQQKTALAKFKFGTQDYDRWAVVYGRVEVSKTPNAAAMLVCAGDSVVMFLVDRY